MSAALKEPKYRRALRYYYHRVFPRHQAPLPVAMSVFLGVFIGVLPTLGVAIALTLAATAMFKLPKTPGVVASFIAIPPTLFLFFYPVGYFLVGVPLLRPKAIDFDFLEVIGGLTLANVGEVGGKLWATASDHVLAFLVGMTIMAALTGAVCFALTFVVMKQRRATQLKLRAERRAARLAAEQAEANAVDPVGVADTQPEVQGG